MGQPKDISQFTHKSFTALQWQVIHAVVEGRSNKEIAILHGSTIDSAKNILRDVYRKVRATNRAELGFWCGRHWDTLMHLEKKFQYEQERQREQRRHEHRQELQERVRDSG